MGVLNRYSALTQGAKALGVSRTAIKKAIVLSRIVKKDYYIKYIEKKINCIVLAVKWMMCIN